jgi:hypothetical protein
MFRLSLVEFACIVAIGVAMVELSAGHRFPLTPETPKASAPAGPSATATASRAGMGSGPSESRR